MWFWISAGATAVAGGFTIASGVDTANRHATFVQDCVPPATTRCPQLSTDGQGAQTRTNVLIGVTAALGAATFATGLLVRWHGASGSATVTAGPGTLSFDGRF